MPRYFIDLRDGSDLVKDEEGAVMRVHRVVDRGIDVNLFVQAIGALADARLDRVWDHPSRRSPVRYSVERTRETIGEERQFAPDLELIGRGDAQPIQDAVPRRGGPGTADGRHRRDLGPGNAGGRPTLWAERVAGR